MTKVDVLVLMGSASDWKHLQGAVGVLRELGIVFRAHVSSAHRTPERTIDLVKTAEADGCKVFICAAGMAAHLAGAVAANTVRPVLGVPLPGGVLDGVDVLAIGALVDELLAGGSGVSLGADVLDVVRVGVVTGRGDSGGDFVEAHGFFLKAAG